MFATRVDQIATAALMVSLALATSTSWAADAAAEQSESTTPKPASLETIVVTAQKRAQEAQDVPVNLYALSNQALESQGITSIQDLGGTVAGVQIQQINPGQMSMSIQGLADFSESNASTSVNGYYLDEVPINWLQGFMPEVGLWDVERVEVLRGPQGTLFGEGAEGGTIRVITRKPDSTSFFGRYEVGWNNTYQGGGGSGKAFASINVPLSPNLLAVSVAAGYTNLPGWIDIPDLNETNSNWWKSVNSRIALRYTPTSALTFDLMYLMNQSNFQNFAATSPYQFNPAAVAPPGLGAPVKADSPQHDRLDIGALTINYDVGFASLVSATSWQRHRNSSITDLSSTGPSLFGPVAGADSTSTSYYNYNTSTLTQELRLVSNGKQTVDWTIGAYGKKDDRQFLQGYTFDLPAVPTNQPYLEDTRYTKKAWAVFGDADYHVTNQFSIQAGLRYYSEKNGLSDLYVVDTPLFGIVGGTLQTADSTASKTSPKVGLSYQLSNDVLLFARAANGFRGGGANAIDLQVYPYVPKGFGSDSVWAYEVGVKTTPLPGYYLNVYAFDDRWTDLQVPFLTNNDEATYTANAGHAQSYGAELEAGGHVSTGLVLGFTFSYIDAYIQDDVANATGTVLVHAGAKLPNTSPFRYALTAQYTKDFTNTLQGIFNARYRISSGQWSDTGNTPEFFVNQQQQLYASVALAGMGEHKWGTIVLWGDNLLNRDDAYAKYPALGAVGYPYISYIRPRNFGLEYRQTF